MTGLKAPAKCSKRCLRVAQCDLNDLFSWISPDIIKLFYGPHDTFISSVSALYPVRGREEGGIPVLYAVFFCYCGVRSLLQDIRPNAAAAGKSRAPPHTKKKMKGRVILSSDAEENRKPNNVILCT